MGISVVYFYDSDIEPPESRRRFHMTRKCEFAGKLLGCGLRGAVANDWYNTCTCHACGLPLSQQPKEEGLE